MKKDTGKRLRSLSGKMLTQFASCIAALLLATPAFYFLTSHFYAEDMIDIIEAVGQGQPVPALDLEQDIMQGVMLQFGLIVLVLAAAIVLTLRFISHRLWRPFDETLSRIEGFRLEDGALPELPESGIREFCRLNESLSGLMRNSLSSYCIQKEFTENASHELQTPLAVFQSRLDVLLQEPGLTKGQAEMIQSLYQVSSRLSRLNRSLLLLARIDNRQYGQMEEICLTDFVKGQLQFMENLSGHISIRMEHSGARSCIKANRTLLESLVNNLVVNAVRHNRPDGGITVTVSDRKLSVTNTSDSPSLDSNMIFKRFYRPSEKTKGNGLGLAIVKAVCDYHGWKVGYHYADGEHCFEVNF